jgi:hypothetical protein
MPAFASVRVRLQPTVFGVERRRRGRRPEEINAAFGRPRLQPDRRYEEAAVFRERRPVNGGLVAKK